MRIGLDFDNTLADFDHLLRRLTLERYAIDLDEIPGSAPQTAALTALGREQRDALYDEIHGTDLTLEMRPCRDAIEVARRLGARHQLVILTARDERQSRPAQQWLRRTEIPIVDFCSLSGMSKAPVAVIQGLTVHLDDNVEVTTAFDQAHPTVPALLAHRMNLGATRAAHWRSVEDWLAFERLVNTLERK